MENIAGEQTVLTISGISHRAYLHHLSLTGFQ